MNSVLIVDDEVKACEVLGKMLTRKGYATYEAHNGVEALDVLSERKIELALMDIRMPVMDGMETLRAVKKAHPTTEVLMLTAISDLNTALECMKAGAYGYLTKPVSASELLVEIEKALERRKLLLENMDYQKNLELKVEEKTQEVGQLYERLDVDFHKAAMMFVDLMGVRDPFLGSHSKRVAVLAGMTRKKFKHTVEDLKEIEIASLLHDVGTLGIPDKMRDMQYSEMGMEQKKLVKRQTIIAQEIFKSIERLQNAGRIIRSHLEWFNGKGFPDGLRGTAIPLESRILCVVNAYDEIKHRRRFDVGIDPGRKPEEMAILYLRSNAGTHFDGDVVKAFLEVLEIIWSSKKSVHEVTINDLKEGMALAADLYAENGQLLLSEGNSLSAIMISKIKSYSELVSPVKQKIYIHHGGRSK